MRQRSVVEFHPQTKSNLEREILNKINKEEEDTIQTKSKQKQLGNRIPERTKKIERMPVCGMPNIQIASDLIY